MRLLDLEAKAPLYSHFLETVSGLIEIRALGWEYASESKSRSLLDASQRPYYLLLCIQRWLTFVLDCMVAGIGTLTVGLSVARVGGTSAGNLGVALVNLINFSQSLADTVTYWASIETSVGAITRIKDFATQTPSEIQPQQTSKLPQDAWPSEGKVEYRNVVAAYSYEDSLFHDFHHEPTANHSIGLREILSSKALAWSFSLDKKSGSVAGRAGKQTLEHLLPCYQDR